MFKDFNLSGETLVQRLREFQNHGVHVLGSFIFGLPTDRHDTFQATEELALRSGLTFAQFVMLTPFCGTVDFERWEKSLGNDPPRVVSDSCVRWHRSSLHGASSIRRPPKREKAKRSRATPIADWQNNFSHWQTTPLASASTCRNGCASSATKSTVFAKQRRPTKACRPVKLTFAELKTATGRMGRAADGAGVGSFLSIHVNSGK